MRTWTQKFWKENGTSVIEGLPCLLIVHLREETQVQGSNCLKLLPLATCTLHVSGFSQEMQMLPR